MLVPINNSFYSVITKDVGVIYNLYGFIILDSLSEDALKDVLRTLVPPFQSLCAAFRQTLCVARYENEY